MTMCQERERKREGERVGGRERDRYREGGSEREEKALLRALILSD